MRAADGTVSGACRVGSQVSFQAEMPRSRNKTNCRYFCASAKELQLQAAQTTAGTFTVSGKLSFKPDLGLLALGHLAETQGATA